MFGKKSIRKRVMEAVNSRIKTAQKQFIKQCDDIDKEAFTKKEDAAAQLVSNILNGKEV